MKASRIITKAGLLLTTAANHVVKTLPRIALLLANAGDRLSALGVKLACYGS